MKIKVWLIAISLTVGAGTSAVYYQNKLSGQEEQTKEARAKVQQLKAQDEVLFNHYRDGINTAIEMMECWDKPQCLGDLTDQADRISDKLSADFKERRELVGAEKH